MKPLFLLLFSFLAGSTSHAAACCGGGYAMPSIISGDDRAQWTSTLSYGEVQADVYTNGNWRKREQSEVSKTLRLDGSHIFRDRWQAGATVPILQRARANEESGGLGDISTLLGYEYLPDWNYHPYRPKGIGFLQLTLPTGRSIYESENVYGLDSRGRGFWALGAGTLLTKAFHRFDTYLNFEGHRSFSKTIEEKNIKGQLKPGWGGSLGLGAGYNLSRARFGGSINWSYEDPVAIEGSINSSGTFQRFTTLALSANYLASEEWGLGLTYSDQTLLGSPMNTSLSRSVMISAQRHWLR